VGCELRGAQGLKELLSKSKGMQLPEGEKVKPEGGGPKAGEPPGYVFLRPAP